MQRLDDDIDPATRALLERYRFDRVEFERLREAVAHGRLNGASNTLRGAVEPPKPDDVTPLPAHHGDDWRSAYETGLASIRRGEVAMAVLNGGMATRFGGVVKGTVIALDSLSFLEWKLAEASRVATRAGGEIPCIVMNSFATDDHTQRFLAERASTVAGMPSTRFFSQSIALRLERDGGLFREQDGRVSPYAPGHGDFPGALRASGTFDDLRRRGVRYVMLSNVDNLGARVDPAVVGMHVAGGRPVTVEVTAKEPGDSGGAPARVDGRLIHVEGFRFPASFDQDSIPVFNTNSFVFDLDALGSDFPLTWFYVEKDVDGRPAVQLERLVNELTSFLPTAFLSVPRSGPRGRFFPIKAPADLQEARPALREMLRSSLLEPDV